MIDYSSLQNLATEYKTTNQNAAREYCQHIFLSNLYKLNLSGVENLLFKGGTALKIVYQSPRFSEDLDFSSFSLDKKNIEEIFINVLAEIEKSGFQTKLTEAKKTSGGYLGKAFFLFLDFNLEIMIQVHFKKEEKINGDFHLITSDYLPAYNLLVLPENILVNEKIKATITRGKPRDFYDVYFILRKNLLIPENKENLKKVLNSLENSKINFKQELGIFLPKDQQQIIGNFENVLKAEIKRHL
ncbi:MAG: nucleotidyl transferase AbiEii/AbiGii toxin family protein [Patescibacteria group bacterium]|nr:nucleotidyl transferase AbiEii/AbiGii toxin family protein [Patescibacteria group bacterium]